MRSEKMRGIAFLLLLLMVVGTVGVFAVDGGSRANVIRVNLGGLLLGTSTEAYGVDIAYERRILDWLGWNVSAWGLSSAEATGLGLGTSADFFAVGRALNGIFVNVRAGVVSGQVYSLPTFTVQTGLSVGIQSILPRGLVFRVGSGGYFVFGYRFLPRFMCSIGYAF
jgi:hypothetical protein